MVGNGGNDVLIGGSGDDVLVGVGAGSQTAGFGPFGAKGIQERDVLTGGAGNDRFILGDNNEIYYLGGGATFADIAIIGTEKPTGGYTGDFGAGDIIQVQKGFVYRIEQSGTNTLIYGTNSASTSASFIDTMAVVVDATIADIGNSLQDQNGASLQLIGNDGVSNLWFA